MVLTLGPERVQTCGRMLRHAFPGLDLSKMLGQYSRLAIFHAALPRKAALLSHVVRLPESTQDSFVRAMQREVVAGRVMAASLRCACIPGLRGRAQLRAPGLRAY